MWDAEGTRGIEAPLFACVLLFLFIWLWHRLVIRILLPSFPFTFSFYPYTWKAQQHRKNKLVSFKDTKLESTLSICTYKHTRLAYVVWMKRSLYVFLIPVVRYMNLKMILIWYHLVHTPYKTSCLEKNYPISLWYTVWWWKDPNNDCYM